MGLHEKKLLFRRLESFQGKLRKKIYKGKASSGKQRSSVKKRG